MLIEGIELINVLKDGDYPPKRVRFQDQWIYNGIVLANV